MANISHWSFILYLIISSVVCKAYYEIFKRSAGKRDTIEVVLQFLFLIFISSVSPEIQPKFVKGSKRYGRRSTPEFIEPISDFSEVMNVNLTEGEDLEDNYDSAVPRKREVRLMLFQIFHHRSVPPDKLMPSLSPAVLACTVFLSSHRLAVRRYS